MVTGTVQTRAGGTKDWNPGDQFDFVMNCKLSFAVGELFLNRGDAKAADDELKILQQNYHREALYGSADPDCRCTYPWGKEDKNLVAYYKQVMGVRNAHKQLFAHGDVKTGLHFRWSPVFYIKKHF